MVDARISGFTFEPNSEVRPIAEQMGLVVLLSNACKERGLYQLLCLHLWIEPAIRHGQIKFYFDERRRPIAYLTWAYLAPDVEYRLSHDPTVLLHESEWNEGDNLWFLDVVAPFGHLNKVIHHARDTLLAGHNEARWLRRNPDGTVRKVAVWRRPRT